MQALQCARCKVFANVEEVNKSHGAKVDVLRNAGEYKDPTLERKGWVLVRTYATMFDVQGEARRIGVDLCPECNEDFKGFVNNVPLQILVVRRRYDRALRDIASLIGFNPDGWPMEGLLERLMEIAEAKKAQRS